MTQTRRDLCGINIRPTKRAARASISKLRSLRHPLSRPCVLESPETVSCASAAEADGFDERDVPQRIELRIGALEDLMYWCTHGSYHVVNWCGLSISNIVTDHSLVSIGTFYRRHNGREPPKPSTESAQ